MQYSILHDCVATCLHACAFEGGKEIVSDYKHNLMMVGLVLLDLILYI